jgi:hypothetical protein
MYGEHQRREWTLLSCHRCGALVLPEHVERHNVWHAMLGSMADKAFEAAYAAERGA